MNARLRKKKTGYTIRPDRKLHNKWFRKTTNKNLKTLLIRHGSILNYIKFNLKARQRKIAINSAYGTIGHARIAPFYDN